jgi:hypothetical protein
LNTRELATVIWLLTLLGFGLTRPWLRESLLGVAKAFAHRTILSTFAAYVGLLAAAVYLTNRVGLWTPQLLIPTLLWFLLSGVVLLFSITEAGKNDRFFRKILGSPVVPVGVG